MELKEHAGIISGSYGEILPRGLTHAACKAMGYALGDSVQLANHYNSDGEVVAQKVRGRNKEFRVVGDPTQMGIYGSHTWKGQKRDRVVLTEGEIDSVTMFQIAAGQFSVGSVPLGAAGAKKSITKLLPLLEEFKEVLFCFDMDAPGREAAEACAKLLSPGKAKIVELPLKDANEMLLAGRAGELLKAVFNAKPYSPASLVSVGSVKEKAKEIKKVTLPWWDDRLTQETYGRRPGEIYMLGAGSGVGKTDWLAQQMKHDIDVLKEKIGVFSLEQQPEETLLRIAGKIGGASYHVPDDGWTVADRDAVLDRLDEQDAITFYDHFGSCEWSLIEEAIRFSFHATGTRIFYVDHLTAIASAEEDERKGLEQVMAKMGALVKEIPILIHCVSHLATPEGKPHEEGGRVQAKHFKGSRAIAFWSHFIFGLERNTQEEDPAKKFTTFRVLKDRFTGRSTGKTLPLAYNSAKSSLEAGFPEAGSPFGTPANNDF